MKFRFCSITDSATNFPLSVLTSTRCRSKFIDENLKLPYGRINKSNRFSFFNTPSIRFDSHTLLQVVIFLWISFAFNFFFFLRPSSLLIIFCSHVTLPRFSYLFINVTISSSYLNCDVLAISNFNLFMLFYLLPPLPIFL